MSKTWVIVAFGIWLASYPASALADDPSSGPCTTDVVAALGGQGQWLIAPDGSPAWQPDPVVVGDDFVPYQTGGEWEERDGARVFVSGWPWGDVVFSQGSWTFDPDAGWLWLPDQRCVQMGPAPMVAGVQPTFLPVVFLPARSHRADRSFGPPMAYPSGRGPGQPARGRGAVPQHPRPVGPGRDAPGAPGSHHPRP